MNDPRTYSNPEDYIRSCTATVQRASHEARASVRQQTHSRLTRVPNSAMSISIIGLLFSVTIAMGIIWGLSTAVAVQIGAVSTAVYSAANDVRISVVHGNPGWRRRHRVLSFLVPRHPMD